MTKYKLNFSSGEETIIVYHDPEIDGIDIENAHWRWCEMIDLEQGCGFKKAEDFASSLWSDFGLKAEVEK